MKIVQAFVDELLKMSADKKGILEAKYSLRLIGDWTDRELASLNATLSKLPQRLVRDNKNLRIIGRAPKIQNAPARAPGHSMYKPNHPKHGELRGALVVFDKGAYTNGKFDDAQFRKSVLHELVHSFNTAPPSVFGTPPFITEYAGKLPKEDFAESFAEFFLHPSLVRTKTPAKFKAIAEML